MERKHRHLQVIDGGSPNLEWKYHDKVKSEIQSAAKIDPGLLGDLLAIMRRVSERSARFGEVEIPLQSHREVGEVRLLIDRRQYRLFVSTPPNHLGIIVALRFWRKSGTDEEIKDIQNNEIILSSNRLDEWLASQDQ